MNLKELGELRRRIRPEKNGISEIYGCYVNANKEIVSDMVLPVGLLTEEETEKYMALLRKTLSGGLGKNLIDIVFSTRQVADSDEHRLLTALRASGLKDGAARKKFYDTVIQSLDMGEDNYLILLAYDRYDVPYHGKDGSRQADASDTVFPYILCTICPVKNGKPVLSYSSEEKEFHNFVSGSVVGTPELGFLFPTFDDRASNIYNALFYTRDPGGIHQEFIDGVFRTEPPMSAQEQRESFQSALVEALDESCSFDVVQSVHEQLRELLAAHKESKDPEPLELSPRELGGILTNCGVSEEGVAAFQEKCAQQFQGRELLQAANLIDSRRFEVKTAETKIAVEPEHSFVLETRIIDGRKYILVPADEGAEINGLSVRIPGKETE